MSIDNFELTIPSSRPQRAAPIQLLNEDCIQVLCQTLGNLKALRVHLFTGPDFELDSPAHVHLCRLLSSTTQIPCLQVDGTQWNYSCAHANLPRYEHLRRLHLRHLRLNGNSILNSALQANASLKELVLAECVLVDELHAWFQVLDGIADELHLTRFSANGLLRPAADREQNICFLDCNGIDTFTYSGTEEEVCVKLKHLAEKGSIDKLDSDDDDDYGDLGIGSGDQIDEDDEHGGGDDGETTTL